ncbi:MAG: transporter [Sphingobacteriales bacterium SCN 48-20]|nr:MAG: transporter [Sphingobacteriales bacterium SCN 48-20]OJW43188.1 MAG: transporter [Sphingobacteriales bacterium 48-107]
MLRGIKLLLLLCCSSLVMAQKWSLRQCVEYAMDKSISVRQADVQARIDALTLEQSKLARLPSASMQNNGGYQFGRSIDPTSNQFTTAEILFANHSLNIGLDLFNWFSKKNTVIANTYRAEAARAGVEKARSDIALNVANAYLQILLSREQINISEVQVKQSKEQVDNISKQVKEGALPELNLMEMEAQLSNDSATLINAQANYGLSVLQLKALLNIEADVPFEVEEPSVESIPVETLSELEPAAVYELAVKNMPQQKINELNLKAAIKNVSVQKAAMYPSLTLFGGLDTRYSNAERLYASAFTNTFVPIGRTPTGEIVTTLDERLVPTTFSKNTYFRQINNNFGQSVGLSLNIPIFNAGIARTNWRKAKLNVESVELQKELDGQTLKQDIYQAHLNAVAALQKFQASQKAVATSQKAYEFARKRFDVGLLNSIDLITNQNNFFRARINLLSAQYDYVFKMKLLEFYKGQGLKL